MKRRIPRRQPGTGIDELEETHGTAPDADDHGEVMTLAMECFGAITLAIAPLESCMF